MDDAQTVEKIADSVTNPLMTVKAEDTLEQVVDELFSQARTTLTLRDGRVVEFKSASYKHIGKIARLFETLLSRVPAEQLGKLIDMIVGEQKNLLMAGKSVNDFDIGASGLVQEAMGNGSLLLTVFANVSDVLPQAVELFSTLGAADFDELEMDEAMLVAAGVVARNYSFFTQTVRPVLVNVMRAWKSVGKKTAPAGTKE